MCGLGPWMACIRLDLHTQVESVLCAWVTLDLQSKLAPNLYLVKLAETTLVKNAPL